MGRTNFVGTVKSERVQATLIIKTQPIVEQEISLGKVFGSLEYQHEQLLYLDCIVWENINHRQFEEKELYFGELVLSL
jgi:hypothetical protein